MHLLDCPSCHSAVPVAPARAGENIECPECQKSIAVPKLGELRRLPRSDQSPEGENSPGRSNESSQRSGLAVAAFVTLCLVAVAAGLGAGYNAVRWSMIDTDYTIETHLAEIDASYNEVGGAQLIREFEDMEKNSLDLVAPYPYQKVADERAKWGFNAMVAGGIAMVCGLGAIVVGSRS